MIVLRWASGVIALSTFIALTILNPVNALLAGLLVASTLATSVWPAVTRRRNEDRQP